MAPRLGTKGRREEGRQEYLHRAQPIKAAKRPEGFALTAADNILSIRGLKIPFLRSLFQIPKTLFSGSSAESVVRSEEDSS